MSATRHTSIRLIGTTGAMTKALAPATPTVMVPISRDMLDLPAEYVKQRLLALMGSVEDKAA